MERSLTILIQFQVSFLKARRIQQSSQFEPCVVFFAAKVREFCRRVSNLILKCVQTLPKCVEDSPSQAGVKSCTKVPQTLHKSYTALPGAFGSNWWTKINYMIKIERIVLFIFQLWAMAMWARLKSNSITFQTLCSASQSCKYFQSSFVQATLKCL